MYFSLGELEIPLKWPKGSFAMLEANTGKDTCPLGMTRTGYVQWKTQSDKLGFSYHNHISKC